MKEFLFKLIAVPVMFIYPFYTYADCGNNNTYPNPIEFCSFSDLVTSIAKSIIIFATPLAVVAIIFIGLRMVTASASGQSSALQNAKRALMYVLIGTVLIVGASALAIAVINTLRNMNR